MNKQMNNAMACNDTSMKWGNTQIGIHQDCKAGTCHDAKHSG